MRTLLEKRACWQLMAMLLSVMLFLCLSTPAVAYYGAPIPSWSDSFATGQNYGWGGYNYNTYRTFADPYMFGPAMGAYYPYNAQFGVYNGGYNYNNTFMGAYNSGYGQQNINAVGYPLPYAYTNQMAWGNQMGFMGYPPVGNSGNMYNIQYDPGAFTVDLGIDAYYTGIGNFWRGVFDSLNEED